MIPDDLTLWRNQQDSGDINPVSPSLRFLADGELPSILDSSYLTADDLANPDIAANVHAIDETAKLITWAAEDEDESRAFGYWRGPHDTELSQAPIVSYDSEGQFHLSSGANLTDALCYEYGDYDDRGYAGLVAECTARGVVIAERDDSAEPTASPTPDEHHKAVYEAKLGRG